MTDNPEPDPPGPLPGKIVDALDRIARARRKYRQANASRHGLSTLQADLLTTLAVAPPPEPVVGTLAAELGLTQPTVTDSVRTLQDKGLLTRERQTPDRRRTGVTLTPAGHAVAEQLDAADGALRRAVGALPPGLQQSLFEALLELIGGLVDAGIVDLARTCVTCRFHRVAPPTGHRCTLLQLDLRPSELRVNCPEHEPVAG